MSRLLVVCTVLVAVVACSDEPTPDERRAALAEELAEDLVVETDGALDADTADCVAQALVDRVGVESFDELVDEAAGPDQSEVEEELRTTVIDAFASCEALQPLLERLEE